MTKAARTASTPRIEEVLWSTADQLRGHMDAAEYKHVVLGLVFLNYISDAFILWRRERRRPYGTFLAEGPGAASAQAVASGDHPDLGLHQVQPGIMRFQ